MIILMAGLPGTGKSTLANALAKITGGCVLSKDQIRAALFGPADVEYSTAQDDFCMEVMLKGATYLLAKNPERKIFLDGRTFSRRYQIEKVLNLAEELGQHWVILECNCSDESAHRRLELEPDRSHPAGNRSFDLYLQVKARFEPIMFPKTTIDTDQPIEECICRASIAIV